MTATELSAFDSFSAPLLGLPVAHIWRGYGTALFLEFGYLHPRRLADGSSGNPAGDIGLMIESGWRIEEGDHLLCSSETDDNGWKEVFGRLMRLQVARASLTQSFELAIDFANGLRFRSTGALQDWTFFDRRKNPERWAIFREGQLRIETAS